MSTSPPRTSTRWLAGRVLTRCDFRVPAYATVDLTGRPSTRSSPGASTCSREVGRTTVHTHLKMEGAWHVYSPDRGGGAREWQARIILGEHRPGGGRLPARHGRSASRATRKRRRSGAWARICSGRTGMPRTRSADARGPGRADRLRAARPTGDRRARERVPGRGVLLRGVLPTRPAGEVTAAEEDGGSRPPVDQRQSGPHGTARPPGNCAGRHRGCTAGTASPVLRCGTRMGELRQRWRCAGRHLPVPGVPNLRRPTDLSTRPRARAGSISEC